MALWKRENELDAVRSARQSHDTHQFELEKQCARTRQTPFLASQVISQPALTKLLRVLHCPSSRRRRRELEGCSS